MIILSTAIALLVVGGLLFAVDGGESASQPASASQPTSKPASQPASQPAKPQVVIETSVGQIVLELNPERTPITVENFLKYADEKYYDGTIFHRVIQGFMIQGGGMTADGSEKHPTHKSIRNESRQGGSNVRGTISMARRPHPDSATCQFFINTVDNARLDTYGGGYTVFGRAIEGMDVVDRIAAMPVVSERPVEDVLIKSVRRR